jgi:hypothetical protein
VLSNQSTLSNYAAASVIEELSRIVTDLDPRARQLLLSVGQNLLMTHRERRPPSSTHRVVRLVPREQR